jgi:hypothetical protein
MSIITSLDDSWLNLDAQLHAAPAVYAPAAAAAGIRRRFLFDPFFSHSVVRASCLHLCCAVWCLDAEKSKGEKGGEKKWIK